MPNKLDINGYQQYINAITNLMPVSPIHHHNMVLMALCSSGIITVSILAIFRKTLRLGNKCWNSHHLVETIAGFSYLAIENGSFPYVDRYVRHTARDQCYKTFFVRNLQFKTRLEKA
jgi:hypothetical protein